MSSIPYFCQIIETYGYPNYSKGAPPPGIWRESAACAVRSPSG